MLRQGRHRQATEASDGGDGEDHPTTPENAVRLHSAMSPESRKLLTTIPSTANRQLHSNYFNHAVRLRLGLGLPFDFRCPKPCGKLTKEGEPIDHILGCSSSSASAFTHRHDRVKMVLAEFLRRAGGFVLVEKSVDLDSSRRLDLVVTSSIGDHHIDVSVVHPLAAAYCAKPEKAIEIREKQKMEKYRADARAAGAVFCPAVVDVFGKFGAGMRQVVDLVGSIAANLPHDPQKRLMQELGEALAFALQKGNVQSVVRALALAERRAPRDVAEANRMVVAAIGGERPSQRRNKPVAVAVQSQPSPSGIVQAPPRVVSSEAKRSPGNDGENAVEVTQPVSSSLSSLSLSLTQSSGQGCVTRSQARRRAESPPVS